KMVVRSAVGSNLLRADETRIIYHEKAKSCITIKYPSLLTKFEPVRVHLIEFRKSISPPWIFLWRTSVTDIHTEKCVFRLEPCSSILSSTKYSCNVNTTHSDSCVDVANITKLEDNHSNHKLKPTMKTSPSWRETGWEKSTSLKSTASAYGEVPSFD
ncbi:hypothetical protein CSKR_100820, partial [Clonorchis sinensis]